MPSSSTSWIKGRLTGSLKCQSSKGTRPRKDGRIFIRPAPMFLLNAGEETSQSGRVSSKPGARATRARFSRATIWHPHPNSRRTVHASQGIGCRCGHPRITGGLLQSNSQDSVSTLGRSSVGTAALPGRAKRALGTAAADWAPDIRRDEPQKMFGHPNLTCPLYRIILHSYELSD